MLFADLVGFTARSEGMDPEEVRDLLSRYFDVCRGLIERYGGTVEKFIGDAVMAVWGAPAATEDDAERAVRTALELVAAVAALGAEVGAPDLRARAGVLTGEAAVTLGATGQGMVAGDLVNTASRLQSAAAAGNGPGRRGNDAGRRPGDRLRRPRAAHPERQGGAGRRSGRPSELSPSAEGWADRSGRSHRSSVGKRSYASSRSCSTPPPGSSGFAWSR